MTNLKGYKVTNCSRSRICGVACKNLTELKLISCKKFEIVNPSLTDVFLQDGTIVDSEDYFATLPQQTFFILAKKGEHFMTGSDLIYQALSALNVQTLKVGSLAKDFFTDNIKEKVRILSEVVKKTSKPPRDKISSSRNDDPDWFVGLETNATTKEDFMRKRCGDRMRGYLYKAQSDLKKSDTYKNEGAAAAIDSTISQLKKMLSENGCMGHYFDRRVKGALCSSDGIFYCDGVWNEPRCKYQVDGEIKHSINPYVSREQRIIFSTWNLDHRIEKSRSVIPCLMRIARFISQNGATCNYSKCQQPLRINCNYFFKLLFTKENLKLVHIVCHDKGAHLDALCNHKEALEGVCNSCAKQIPDSEKSTGKEASSIKTASVC